MNEKMSSLVGGAILGALHSAKIKKTQTKSESFVFVDAEFRAHSHFSLAPKMISSLRCTEGVE